MAQTPRRLRIVTDSSRNPAASSGSNTSDPDMAVLVERAAAGEREAFDDLVRLTHRDAFGLAVRLTGNEEDARDVVQDAYLRAYRSIGRFRGDARFSTWLYRIVANCASTFNTRKGRQRTELLADDDAVVEVHPDRDPVQAAEAADLRDELDAAIQDLPPRLRSVIVLRDGPSGPETLMLRKNSKIAFGGMWVFPGGKVDQEDWDGADDAMAAAANAAIREAAEEARLRVELDEMVVFAHWIPPAIAPKRYATWFFAAPVDDDDVIIDDGEIVDMEWTTPATAIDKHHGGEIEIVPPTWVTIDLLTGHDTVASLLAFLDERPAR